MKIKILEPYKWFGTTLPGGAILEVGTMYHGHMLSEERADRMVKHGIAKAVE